MNKRTQYEQQLAEELKHLQLPDEDKAWAAMQRLLDKNDSNRPPVAAPLLRKGCNGWAALLVILLLAGGAAYYFLTGNQDKEKIGQTAGRNASEAAIKPSEAKGSISNSASGGYINDQDSSNPSRQQGGVVLNPNDQINPGSNNSIHNDKDDNKNSSRVNGRNKERVNLPAKSASRSSGNNQEEVFPGNKKRSTSRAKSKINVTPSQPGNTVISEEDIKDGVNDNSVVKDEVDIVERIDITLDSASKEITDSLGTAKVIDPVLTDTVSLNEEKKQDTAKRKKIFFAAGLAVQHAISFNGESGLMSKKPYSNDYLPSIYLRLHKNKWFLQTEFRYSAPQNVKGFTYRNINQDTVQGVHFATSYALRRTYSHQLPISLHYMIKPGWSIGAGVIYNRFAGTISEKSLRLSVAGTPVDTILEKNLVDAKYDSVFAKNTWQWMAESQYKWKRFSFGLRYASGLQPFIRYRDVQGIQRSKKQNSLNVFIRYELWRSKK